VGLRVSKVGRERGRGVRKAALLGEDWIWVVKVVRSNLGIGGGVSFSF